MKRYRLLCIDTFFYSSIFFIHHVNFSIMKKKILFMVSSANIIGPRKRHTGNLLTEVAHPYEIFKKQGYDIDVYSVKGGEAPIEMFEETDPMNAAFLKGDGPAKF